MKLNYLLKKEIDDHFPSTKSNVCFFFGNPFLAARADRGGNGANQAVCEGGGGPSSAWATQPDAVQQVHPNLPPPLWPAVQAQLLRIHQAHGALRGNPRHSDGTADTPLRTSYRLLFLWGFWLVSDLLNVSISPQILECGEEKVLTLTEVERIKALAAQLVKLLRAQKNFSLSVSQLLIEYSKTFGYGLRLQDYDAATLPALLAKLCHVVKVKKKKRHLFWNIQYKKWEYKWVQSLSTTDTTI